MEINYVVLVSGGLDSATLLYHVVKEQSKGKVAALSILYGQRHRIELEYAPKLCEGIEVPHEVIDLTNLLPALKGSSQTSADIDVPLGHYEEDSMKATVVPNRNMILLSTAAAWAISHGYNAIAYAAHAGDHAIYPDCRYDFANAMRSALRLCDWTPIHLYVPFINQTKTFIAKEAVRLGVPIEMTYSCYQGGKVQCGICATCYERRLAFQEAGLGLIDPTEYANPMPNYTRLIKIPESK